MALDDLESAKELYSAIALAAARELRVSLRIDEDAFRHTAISLWHDPRPAFIYRVLDEVQKAGLCILDWVEKLADHERAGEGSDHSTRLVTQWLQDEQSFRIRKLVETLVNLICFSATNEPEYYRDYLRLRDLDASVRSLRDQDEFFGFKRRNTQYTVDWFAADISGAENRGLDVSKRWYLTSGAAFDAKWKTRGVPFSSFRQRYIQSFDLAFPAESAALGKSYIHAYGMSAEVHFTPEEISSAFDPRDVFLGIHRVGLLCYGIIIRSQHLLGIVPEGANANLRSMHDANSGPAEMVAQLKTEKATVGDFMWADGSVCEVVEVKRSKYGYVSYRLRYIERPPIPEITEDWFASFEVRLVATRKLAEEALQSIETDPDIDQDTKARFRAMETGDRGQLLGRAVSRLQQVWQQVRAAQKVKDATPKTDGKSPE